MTQNELKKKEGEYKMKHSNEVIASALKVIQEECEHAKDCSQCPFGNHDDDCMIEWSHPNEWTINNPSDSVWRGLV